MNIKYVMLLTMFVTSTAFSQKQVVDVDLLSDIIAKKQEELKVRVLSNIVVKNIRTTNYTTYNSIYNLVDILTTEKNKTVMTQAIIWQIAEYSISYGLANYFFKKRFDPSDYGVNGFKRKNDDVGIFDLLKRQFISEEEPDQQTQSNKIKKKEQILGMNASLLANFIIDTLYQSFSTNAFLLKKGLFKRNTEHPFFVTGLDIDYDPIRKSTEFQTKIEPQLNSFLQELSSLTDAADKAVSFIKDNDIQFEKLKDLSPESVGKLLELFDQAIETFRDEIGKNSFIATIGDIIKKYVIFDMVADDGEKVYQFKIDVEAIILAFEDKFYSMSITSIRKYKVGVKPFFSIGLNYGYFRNQDVTFELDNVSKNITQLAFAGENVSVPYFRSV